MSVCLSPSEISVALEKRPGWRHDPERRAIVRELSFANFGAAFAFMTRVALVAERHDHHPDWRNVWNRVEIALSTHDAGGVTERDFKLATAIDQILGASDGDR